LNKLHETVSNSYFLLEEAASSIRNEWEALEFDPNHLEMVEKRLNEISFLQKKYGKTVNDILEYGSEIEDEIDKINYREQHIEKYKKELSDIEDDLLLEAKHLSEIRRQIAHKLTDAIQRELKQLYMEKTVFTVNFKESQPLKFDKKGIDDVEFLISTNLGEPLKPLSKVASGGELSRIMLALKSIFSKHQGITSIIFDEVDTGVSGRVAQAIGEKIHNVSIGSQVLCITHLPQVAAMADTHLYISKETKGERTKTYVKPLKNDEQIEEIGRMISGTEITQLTKEHARELIEMAQEIKTGVEKKHLPL
jgi:DNA repair protein RecN (Recombination protein N)